MANEYPWSKFFWSDWRKDADLARCSKAAKGMWMDTMCVMRECEESGVLASDGIAWTDEEIAQAVGGDVFENVKLLNELLSKRVASRKQNDESCPGAVYSRRLVREAELSQKRAEAGAAGGRARSSKPQANGQQESSSAEDFASVPLARARGRERARRASDSDSDSDSDSSRQASTGSKKPIALSASPEGKRSASDFASHACPDGDATHARNLLEALRVLPECHIAKNCMHAAGNYLKSIPEPHKFIKRVKKQGEDQGLIIGRLGAYVHKCLKSEAQLIKANGVAQ